MEAFFQKLRGDALDTGIDANIDNETADAAFFYADVDLTEQGLADYHRVVEILFRGLGTLGRLRVPTCIFDQHNTMAISRYQWQGRRSDVHMCSDAVRKMRQEDIATYSRKSMFWGHAPFDVAEIFLHLSRNRSILFVLAKSSDIFNITFDKSGPIVGAKYTINNFTDSDKALFNVADRSLNQISSTGVCIPDQNLHVLRYLDPPQANRFRWEPPPATVEVLKSSSESFLSIFIAGDTEFGIPNSASETRFSVPRLV